MESLPPLDALPMGAANGGLSKREVYRQVGGHPYTLNMLAGHASRQHLEQVLAGATGLKGELLAFTLMEKAAAQLPERAQQLLRRAAVYQQPAPEEGLAYLLGDEHDCMPEVGDEVHALLDWGLLVRLPGGAGLVMPALVQDWLKTEVGRARAEKLAAPGSPILAGSGTRVHEYRAGTERANISV